MAIDWERGERAWRMASESFEPFVSDVAGPGELAISVRACRLEPVDGKVVYSLLSQTPGVPSMRVLSIPDGSVMVALSRPGASMPYCHVAIDSDLRHAEVNMAESAKDANLSRSAAETSAAMMLAYMLAGLARGVMVAHASAVVHRGKAILFQGRSGTGKSTHSRLWTIHIPHAELLNDDHPLVRVNTDGGIVAYGSPWSGKTPCYRQTSAPLGAMVRIRRASVNTIRRLTCTEAFASVTTSMSNAPFHSLLASMRHEAIAKLVATVPCFELSCRPDADAAHVCNAALKEIWE